jgi:hypothetical protein
MFSAVTTSIPLFAGQTGASGDTTPVHIESYADYIAAFGTDGALAPSIELFYANGGGEAYVLSMTDMPAVQAALLDLIDVELLVMPGVTDYASINAALAACATLDRCFLIADLPNGDLTTVVPAFCQALDPKNLSYGAAYVPWLDVNGTVVPTSGAVAGVYARTDSNAGVWISPSAAEGAVAGITKPVQALTEDQVNTLSLVPSTAIAINAIASLPDSDPYLVDGLTLDGTSNVWRYVSTRRLVIMISESIRRGLRSWEFAPNNGMTWSAINASVSVFLNGLWKEGAFPGESAEDAWAVQIGVGSTMSPIDVQNGILRLTVQIAPLMPGQFIVLSFEQVMPVS